MDRAGGVWWSVLSDRERRGAPAAGPRRARRGGAADARRKLGFCVYLHTALNIFNACP